MLTGSSKTIIGIVRFRCKHFQRIDPLKSSSELATRSY